MPPVIEAIAAIVFLVVLVVIAGACFVGFSKLMDASVNLANRLFPR